MRMPLLAGSCVEGLMKLPSHVLTKLSVASVVGTVAVVATLDPREPCRPCEATAEAVIIEEDAPPLVEEIRMTREPTMEPTVAPRFAVPPPKPSVHRPRPKPPHPKPLPPKSFIGCGPCGRG